jgi:type I restriction enzyme S subunit
MYDPDPWQRSTLGEVASLTVGGTPSTEVSSYWGGPIPWMASGDVHQRRIMDVPGRITALGLSSSNATLVDPPAVAIGLAGQGKTRGTAALVERRLCTNQSVALISGDGQHLLTSFLFHDLDYRYEELRARSSGGGRGGLSKAILEQIPLLLPPLQEQRRIAEILDTVDNTIRSTKQLIAKLELMKQGLRHDLLTRGIDRRGSFRDPVRSPSQFHDTPLGVLPKDWEVVELASIAELITSGSRGWARYYSESGAIFLRIGNLTRRHVNLRFTDIQRVRQPYGAEGERTAITEGDTLISITADLGIVGVVPPSLGPAFINQHIALVRPCNDQVMPRWVGHFLTGDRAQIQFRQLNDAGAKAGLNLPTVGRLLVALPDRTEQASIVSLLDEYDRSIASNEVIFQSLDFLKQGLMEDLLTGHVRVNPDRGTA